MVWLSCMIRREAVLNRVRQALARNPVVGLIGPRQCGKTTLARQIVPAHSIKYFDLEDPTSIARLAEPMTALAPLRGVVVIDEVQRRPELFPVLRVLADTKSRR
jgi:predicted AAA+ superfamily ATPase